MLKFCVPQGVEELELEKRVNECKEALFKLDAAAGNALQLISDLSNTNSREDASCKSSVELYDWAGKLLPTITEKLQSLGDVVQSKSLSPNTTAEDSRVQLLLEKFAGSLSSQVLELVKKGL